jgi:hypothetical protein
MLYRKFDRDNITNGHRRRIDGGLQLGLRFLRKCGANAENEEVNRPDSNSLNRTGAAAAALTLGVSAALGRGEWKSPGPRQKSPRKVSDAGRHTAFVSRRLQSSQVIATAWLFPERTSPRARRKADG